MQLCCLELLCLLSRIALADKWDGEEAKKDLSCLGHCCDIFKTIEMQYFDVSGLLKVELSVIKYSSSTTQYGELEECCHSCRNARYSRFFPQNCTYFLLNTANKTCHLYDLKGFDIRTLGYKPNLGDAKFWSGIHTEFDQWVTTTIIRPPGLTRRKPDSTPNLVRTLTPEVKAPSSTQQTMLATTIEGDNTTKPKSKMYSQILLVLTFCVLAFFLLISVLSAIYCIFNGGKKTSDEAGPKEVEPEVESKSVDATEESEDVTSDQSNSIRGAD